MALSLLLAVGLHRMPHMKWQPCRSEAFDVDPGNPATYPPWAPQPSLHQGTLQYKNGDVFQVRSLASWILLVLDSSVLKLQDQLTFTP